MPLDLAALVAPDRTAVLTMEVQRGVVGDLATNRALADEVAAQHVVDAVGRLVAAARQAGARVVHCTASFRADRAGSATNSPMLRAVARDPGHLLDGTAAVDVVPELGPEPQDLVSARRHGVAPFTGTDLDATLRNLGVRTVVATGVSLNLGIVGLAIEAVNLGYEVVVPVDAVAGVPRAYGDAVLEHTLPLVAVRSTVDQLVAVWSGDAGDP